jgi:YHS domain-containing protein
MITETVHDPVCHMDISPDAAAGRSEYEGKTYYFCAIGCKRDFDEDPAGVLKAEAEYDHSQPMDHGMGGMSTSPEKKPWWKFWG